MTNPYRALCAELLNGLDELAHPRYPFPGYTCCAMDRARAALAEPEGTDGEVPRIGHILRLAEIIREVDGNHDKGAAALAEAILSHPGIRSAGLTAYLLAEPVAEGPTDEQLNDIADETPWRGSPGHFGREVARAVLARWGRPAAAPAPEGLTDEP